MAEKVASQEVDGSVKMGVSEMYGVPVMGFFTASRMSESAAEMPADAVAALVSVYRLQYESAGVVDLEPVENVSVDVEGVLVRVAVAPVVGYDSEYAVDSLHNQRTQTTR